MAIQLWFPLLLRPENQGKLYSIPLMDWLADKYKDTNAPYLGGNVVVTTASSDPAQDEFDNFSEKMTSTAQKPEQDSC